MEFEWDENKNLSNQKKHGLSFFEAKEIFDGPVFTVTDTRQTYGEIRQISIGAMKIRSS